jgi:transforming growth factor-beta-induced protein
MQLSLFLALAALNAPAPSGGDACASPAAQQAGKPAQKDIVTTAVEAGQFKTLAAALGAAQLVDALKGEGPFTVFAPTDAAFAKLPKGTLEALLAPEGKGKLTEILKYHVVAAKLPSAALAKLPGAESLAGPRLTVNADEDGVSIAGARVVTADIACSNGVIHVIDTVLLPPMDDIVALASGAGTFETLLAAAKAAGLAETLATGGPFTVLAPTDEAFAKLPAGTVASLLEPANKEKLAAILKAHVIAGRVFSDQVATLTKADAISGYTLAIRVEGSSIRIGGAKVVKADLQARNGVVHVIDSVIVPE